MKRNNFKRLFALVAMAAVMLAPIFGHALVANANPAHPGIADETTPRVITVWKYAVENLDESGDRGDGTHDPNAAGEPFEGVTFRVVRVIPLPVDAADPTGPRHSLTNPRTQVQGTHWELDTTFAAMEVATLADGSAVFNLGTGRSADGVYLITELHDPRIVRAVDPFFVHMPQTRRTGEGANATLIYHVHVQPKNVPLVELEPDKTIDGGRYLSVMAGQVFSWELTSNVPNDMVHRVPEGIDTVIQSIVCPTTGTIIRHNANSGNTPSWPLVPGVMFEFRDVLSPHLTLVQTPAEHAPVMEVRLAGGSWQALAAEHFTFAHNATTNQIVFALTPAGMLHINALQIAGGARLDAEIRGIFYTRVNPVEVPSGPGDDTFNGILCNTFGVYYLGPDWQLPYGPGNYPPDGEYPDPDDHPIYAVGGLNIVKTDESRNVVAGALAGAEFHIAISEAYAREGRFLANNGNSYTAATLPTGVSFLVSTSDANGRVSFSGLPLEFVPGFDPSYVLPIPSPFPTTLPGHAVADSYIFRNFWVVETVAPSGFELLRNPIEVRVTINTHLEEIGVVIPNQAITFLPFTGGLGTAFLVLIAIAVIGVGTGALVYDKKRRRS